MKRRGRVLGILLALVLVASVGYNVHSGYAVSRAAELDSSKGIDDVSLFNKAVADAGEKIGASSARGLMEQFENLTKDEKVRTDLDALYRLDQLINQFDNVAVKVVDKTAYDSTLGFEEIKGLALQIGAKDITDWNKTEITFSLYDILEDGTVNGAEGRTEEDKSAIRKSMRNMRSLADNTGMTIGTFVDLELTRKLGDGEATRIMKTDRPIKLVFKIAPSMRGYDSYCMFRDNDGVTEMVKDMDENPDTVTIYARKCYAYAMAYEDAVISDTPIFSMKKTVSLGSSFRLNLVGNDEGAKITYSSSMEGVASVSEDGVITANSVGEACISGTVEQGGTAYRYQVRVTVPEDKNFKNWNLKDSILREPEEELPEVNIYKVCGLGKSIRLRFKNVVNDAVVTFSSSNEEVATVDDIGRVSGIEKGMCVITADVTLGEMSYTYKVVIRVSDGGSDASKKEYLYR